MQGTGTQKCHVNGKPMGVWIYVMWSFLCTWRDMRVFVNRKEGGWKRWLANEHSVSVVCGESSWYSRATAGKHQGISAQRMVALCIHITPCNIRKTRKAWASKTFTSQLCASNEFSGGFKLIFSLPWWYPNYCRWVLVGTRSNKPNWLGPVWRVATES